MSSREKIIDDVARVAGGAVGVLSDAGREAKAIVRSKVDTLAQDMDLVPREDYEVLESMVEALRSEQDELKKRIEKLEKKNKA